MACRRHNRQADRTTIDIADGHADLRQPRMACDRRYRERPLVEIGKLRCRGILQERDTRRRRHDQADAVAKHRANAGGKGCADLEYNWVGTDDQGRDIAARLIYGFRISVLFGLTLTIISSIIGVAAGAVQGYFGGWTDLLFQRLIEVWTSIPSLYLLLIISSVLVPGFFVLLGIMLLFSWVSLVGLVRAEFLRGRNFEYVQAARALGHLHDVFGILDRAQ